MDNKVIYKRCYDGAQATVFVYRPQGGTAEAHVMLQATDGTMTFEAQVDCIRQASTELQRGDLKGMRPVFKRCFLSDSANQVTRDPHNAEAGRTHCATSLVEQPPLDGTKLALLLYMQEGGEIVERDGNIIEVSRGAYRHLWSGLNHRHADTSEEQTRRLLTDYADALRRQGCTLERNCVRTWFFVQNVDVNYSGLVKARNEVFAREGLTADSHFIASTGIGGRHYDHRIYVTMDTYAVAGLQPGQMNYLYARTHLNPTYEYGVSFERGATVDYADRRHVFISGTASINNKGQVVHEGDIRRQAQRMWDNVEALLAEASCSWDDVGHIIVYLRDVSDYAVVRQMFDERFPLIPRVITYARVCRPGWLIEMECMALRPADNPQYEPF